MTGTGVIAEVRALILGGALKPGTRVTEAALADRLGVSRTPIRSVLPVLAREGFLILKGRSYAVRAFTPAESLTALEIRCALEGLAARFVARAGPSPEVMATLRSCLGEGDAIFASDWSDAASQAAYSAMNGRFHQTMIDAAGSDMIREAFDRASLVPFAAPTAIAFDPRPPAEVRTILSYAHRQHHAIVAAIGERDATRAEFLFREHADPQRISLNIGAGPASQPPTKRGRTRRAAPPV